jgi:hypothetical protein
MAIVFFCIERGYLESQAIRLARSIQQFGTLTKRDQVFAISPREPDHYPSPETISILAELSVEVVCVPLNDDLVHYPVSNKSYAGAWLEERFENERIVMLDTDIIVLSGIETLTRACSIQIKPVHHAKAAYCSIQSDARLIDYWETLFTRFNLDRSMRSVVSTVDKVEIFPYFNTGVLAAPASLGVFRKWRDRTRTLFSEGLEGPERRRHVTDQFAFATLWPEIGSELEQIDERLNFPLPLLDRMSLRSLEDVRIVHYHGLMDKLPIRLPQILALLEPCWQCDYLNESAQISGRLFDTQPGLVTKGQ